MRFIDTKGENYTKFVNSNNNSKLNEFGKWGLYYAIPNNVEYFGLIVDEFNVIIPYVDTDVEIVDNTFYGYTYLENDNDFKLSEPLPFIFKIFDSSDGQQYAQELLSGKKIRIQDPDEFYDVTDKMDNEGKERIYSFQAQYEDRKSNPLMIIPKSPYYVVDDAFKMYYESKVKDNEQRIIDSINESEKRAKEKFDLFEKELIDRLQTIAYTDNLMKNLEYQNKKLR